MLPNRYGRRRAHPFQRVPEPPCFAGEALRLVNGPVRGMQSDFEILRGDPVHPVFQKGRTQPIRGVPGVPRPRFREERCGPASQGHFARNLPHCPPKRIPRQHLTAHAPQTPASFPQGRAQMVLREIMHALPVQNAGTPFAPVIHVVGGAKSPVAAGPAARRNRRPARPKLLGQRIAVRVRHGKPDRTQLSRQRIREGNAPVHIPFRYGPLLPPAQPQKRGSNQVRAALLVGEAHRNAPPPHLARRGLLRAKGRVPRQKHRGGGRMRQSNQARMRRRCRRRAVIRKRRVGGRRVGERGARRPTRGEAKRGQERPQGVFRPRRKVWRRIDEASDRGPFGNDHMRTQTEKGAGEYP